MYLKGKCADFTHQSLCTGLGEYYFMCEKSLENIKPFVARGGGVLSLIKSLE